MDEDLRQFENEEEWGNHERRVFRLLAAAGLNPKTVYDIGAANGSWSELLYAIYPNAVYHLFEPLAEHRPSYKQYLRDNMSKYPSLHLHPYALGEDTRLIEMHLLADGYGSSTLPIEHPDFSERLTVQQYSLDEYVAAKNLPLPDILKMDVQGAEGTVLRGASRCLEHAGIVFAETWLERDYGPQTPLVTEIHAQLLPFGFEFAEIGSRAYSSYHRLFGFDAYFVKQDLLTRLAPQMPRHRW
jgi:FkbM family methyltransferase